MNPAYGVLDLCEAFMTELVKRLMSPLTVVDCALGQVKAMRRNDAMVAALSPGGEYRYTPVQVQKLFFLLDRQIPRQLEGPFFDFKPYHYGPFDRSVYDALSELATAGLVRIDGTGKVRTFSLTPAGVAAGETALQTLERPIQDHIRATSNFVRTQSFSSLVSAIYKAFPEMRAKSVFQD